MPKPDVEQTETETVDVVTETVDEVVEPEKVEEPDEQVDEVDTTKDADLPDWARAELTRVRNEAAKARVSLREAMTKFEGAKTPEEFAAAVAEVTAENTRLSQDLARTTVGTKHSLPQELIDVLKGDTPAELEAHAKLLSKFVTGDEPGSLSGGLDPSGEDGSFDPVAEARKARSRRY